MCRSLVVGAVVSGVVVGSVCCWVWLLSANVTNYLSVSFHLFWFVAAFNQVSLFFESFPLVWKGWCSLPISF